MFFVFACESQPRGEANAYGEGGARLRASVRRRQYHHQRPTRWRCRSGDTSSCRTSARKLSVLVCRRKTVRRTSTPVTRAKEASFITTTKDPAGFTLVDLLAWGSIGHALGFLALASQSAQQML